MAPELWQRWGGGSDKQGAQGTPEGAVGEGRTARERWALVRLVSRLALRNNSRRGSRRGSADEVSHCTRLIDYIWLAILLT